MIKDIAYIHKLSQIALKEMRLQLFELRSKELLQTPIEKLAQELVELVQTRIGTEFSVQIDDVNEHFKHNPILKVAVYRIMREAIFNTIKHANATMIKITITDSEHHGMLVVEDDGIGIDKLTEFRRGSGISNMYERATQAGIDLNIDTQSGVGTKVQVIWENKDNHGGEHSHSTRR
jgi:signal transduction histidine kinase